MAKYRITGPDGKAYEITAPDGATEQEVLAYVQQNAGKPARTPDALDNPNMAVEGMGTGGRVLAGAGKAVADAGRGIAQRLGLRSAADEAESRKVDAPLMGTTAGKVGNIGGNLAMFAPTAMIPGANTYTGAALTGAAMGAMQPTVEGESALANAGIGAVGGAVGKGIGDKVAGMVTRKEVAGAADASRNALRDATLRESQQAGYVLPKSEVSPGFFSNRLESMAGKAALKQDATLRNQEVTNALARKAAGLPDDAPISVDALEALRSAKAGPYREVAALNPRAAYALEELKKARHEMKGLWDHVNKTGDPNSAARISQLENSINLYETAIEKIANSQGKPDLAAALRQARKEIAQTHDIERALNVATGDVDARVIGRMLDKGKPLSDGLDTIGKFQQAFPKFSGPRESTPAAGVSKSEMLASLLLGGGGAAAAGPAGMAAAAIPFAAPGVRSMLLSKPYQNLAVNPSYGPGAMARGLRALSPQLPIAGAYGAVE